MQIIPESRFWSQLTKTEEDACWLWQGRPDRTGYGQMRVGGKKRQAHRLSWIIQYGPIPPGLWVLHQCDVPLCVNPNHLFLGTRQDNVDDMMKKGRGPNFRGSKNPRAKLDEKKVEALRHRYAAGGVTQAQLSRVYGVNQTKISEALRGVTWPHAKGPLAPWGKGGRPSPSPSDHKDGYSKKPPSCS